MTTRPPLPPFTAESAALKVQMAEDGWNSRDPHKVSLAYTEDSQWRNRDLIFSGRENIVKFLSEKWQKEQNYKLKKELWCFDSHRIAVKFFYEWQDAEGQWYRSYGNELWQFNDDGLMERREASINDAKIDQSERQLG
ncbi:nuclear transport factor 2 family protein [Neptunicella marina]|uniref:Nuclear transport factor 2 family protein n=1 Tax=Neptunicella marina TaxID=2125989 RepID=A0A8J6M3P9_9ALTE|nr:nuclear transport factor 2 family protein [Neptunicella marina]MBC3767302.1 nuclear transport factor 2 family protein [Neptunicella marina]